MYAYGIIKLSDVFCGKQSNMRISSQSITDSVHGMKQKKLSHHLSFTSLFVWLGAVAGWLQK